MSADTPELSLEENAFQAPEGLMQFLWSDAPTLVGCQAQSHSALSSSQHPVIPSLSGYPHQRKQD